MDVVEIFHDIQFFSGGNIMSRSAMLLVATLTFSIMCCCGGIFGADGLQGLIERNVEGVVEENVSETEEMQAEIETRVVEVESGQGEAVEGTPAAEESQESIVEGEQGEETGDVPAVELPDDLPTVEGEAGELAEGLLGAIEEQLGEGGEELLDFGCDGATIPMPPDVAECVSVAGFTTYSTAMGEDDINQMYDDYFIEQGWEHFDQAIQEDITNAWAREAAQSYAILTFLEGEGEGGNNLVSIAVVGGE
jgi:hypothetical protein